MKYVKREERKAEEKQIMNRNADRIAFTEARLGSIKLCVCMSFNEIQ